MRQWLFSHHIFRYVILWEAHGDWLSSKTPGCVYNKGDLLKQGWHWEPSGGGIYLENSRALAKLWSALVLYPPLTPTPLFFLFLPTTGCPKGHRRPQGVTLVSWQQGQAWLQLPDCVQAKRGPLSLIIPSLFHLPWNTVPTDGQWLFSCSANDVCSVCEVRSRALNAGYTFVGFW